MRNFQSRKVLRRRIYSKTMVAVLLVLIVLLGKSIWEISGKYRLAKDNRDAALAEVAGLEERKSNLEYRIEHLKTDRGVEEEIRKNFTVVKEGEQLVTIVDDAATSTEASEKRKPWWQRMFNF